MNDDLLLREGTRLVHVGPPKTATTSLQAAFHAARPVLAEHGVHYAGKGRHAMLATVQAVGGRGFLGGPTPGDESWQTLLTDIHDAGDARVVYSSEYLAQAGDARVQRIVEEIDPKRTHVVLTLRPLDKLIPSQWQQYVQTGYDIGYDDWLRAMFSETPPRDLTPSFWTRHRHDRLAARWAAAVGPENVTVVVLDPRDREGVLRVFEQLVGLPSGTLALQEDLSNRSLTLPEIEVVRALNRRFRAEGWPDAAHYRYIRNGVVASFRTRQPGPDDAKIRTPAWAQDRIAALTEEMVANLAAADYRVVGDLRSLVAQPAAADAVDQTPQDARIAVPVAALALEGVVGQAGVPEVDRARTRAWRPMKDYPTRALAKELARRLRHRGPTGG